jgi:hypothetical protein
VAFESAAGGHPGVVTRATRASSAELLAAHRLWIEWLDEGRVRTLALVAERA